MWNLIWSTEERTLDRAIEGFEIAAAAGLNAYKETSDLSAAYLTRFSITGSGRDLGFALDAALRALRGNQLYLPALFNRALALEKLALPAEAREAWNLYLQVEKDGDWRREAKDRIAGVSAAPPAATFDSAKVDLDSVLPKAELQAVVEGFPRESQEFLDLELLPRWAEAALSNRNRDAIRLLEHGHRLATALANARSDALTLHEIETLTVVAPNKRHLLELATGHAALNRGRQHLQRFEIASARVEFRSAAHLLAGDPFAVWPHYYLAICQYQDNDYLGAIRELTTLVETESVRSYPTFKARVLRMIALSQAIIGNLDASTEALADALRLLSGLPITEQTLGLRAMKADLSFRLGDLDAGWQQLLQALEGSAGLGAPRLDLELSMHAAYAANLDGLDEAELVFRNRMVRYARAAARPALAISALSARAPVQGKLGRQDDAEQDLSDARRLLTEIPDSATAATFGADLDLIEAQLVAQSDPERALQAADRAISGFEATGYEVQLATAYLKRARIHEAQGQTLSALTDIKSGIRSIERVRANVVDREQRRSFMDIYRKLYDESAALHLEQGETLLALAFADASRARVLRDALAKEAGASPRINRQAVTLLQQSLAPTTRILYFVVLPNRLHVWLVGPEDVRVGSVEIRQADLELVARQFHLTALRAPARETDQIARDLGRLLLSPILDGLPSTGHLIVVPDRPLHQIPFAALVDPRSGRYLIEQVSIEIAPSLALAAIDPAEPMTLRGAPLLVAYDQSGDPATNLPILPGATEEVTRIAALYGNATVLEGAAANLELLRSSLPGHSLLHFAGHAIVNGRDPARSEIHLAGSSGTSGVLRAAELAGLPLDGIQLVVLSACDTAAGRVSDTEGVSGFAQLFLARGVPAVVATLWSVEDEGAAAMSVRFHEHLHRGHSVAEALRYAQLDQIEAQSKTSQPSLSWAAFQTYRANSEPRSTRRNNA